MLTVNTTEGIEPQDAEIFFEEPPVRATDDRARALRAYLSGTFPERTERRSKHVMASEQQLVQNRNDSVPETPYAQHFSRARRISAFLLHLLELVGKLTLDNSCRELPFHTSATLNFT